MKKRASTTVKKATRKTKVGIDKVASEFADIKEKKIPARDLVWRFRFQTSNEKYRRAATETCVDFLAGELGKRCRVVLETATVKGRKIQDFILKPTKMTPDLLRELDRGMAQCCKRTKVSYGSFSYGEVVYKQDSWKTLGSVLKPVEPSARSVGDLDCRTLRCDGLYYHKTGDTSGDWLRFYPDGQCIGVSVSDGDAGKIARWFAREGKGAAKGTYLVRGSSLSAVIEYELPNNQPCTVKKLKGRLTREGLKVRAWNSFTKKESEERYVFYDATLK